MGELRECTRQGTEAKRVERKKRLKIDEFRAGIKTLDLVRLLGQSQSV